MRCCDDVLLLLLLLLRGIISILYDTYKILEEGKGLQCGVVVEESIFFGSRS